MATDAAEPESGEALALDSLTRLHWIGIALAAITGLIHLWLAVSFLPDPEFRMPGVAFLVATLGFFAGIAAMLTDFRRRLFVLVGIPFTAGQIPLWYVANRPDFSPLGIGDKVVQVALVAVLVVLYRRD